MNLMFENNPQPLMPRRQFLRRTGIFAAIALLLVGGSWLIGILGYRILEHMSWIDAVLNSAMILGGMGPVNPLTTDAGKLFASFYALFAGIVFLVSVGLFIAPIFHRLMHKFHLESAKDDKNNAADDNN
ncbi:MAG: hypothetical protein ABI835_21755 [Chloroflexota bacterium]